MAPVSEIVVRDRALARVLAILPAVVIAACVRVLTRGTPPAAARVAAAGVVAIAAWTAWRILTARVTVTGDAVHVRGVLYDADVALADLHSVSSVPAPWPVRALVWGVMRPRAVRLVTGTKALRPLAMLGAEDDEDIDRALRALLVRGGTRLVPAQRDAEESGVTTG